VTALFFKSNTRHLIPCQIRRGIFDVVGFDEVTSIVSSDPSEIRETTWSSLKRDRGFRALGEAIVDVVVVLILSWRLASVYVAAVPIVATVNVLGGITLGKLMRVES
jgi:ABC-type multidrug transport system fused ATPase/permease subunit